MENIIRKSDFNTLTSLEYLADHIDNADLQELRETLLDFMENHINSEYQPIFYELAGSIIFLLENKLPNINAYHVDTQENDTCWRIQIRIDDVEDLTPYLKDVDNLLRRNTLYLEERGKVPYFSIFDNSLIFTGVVKKC